MAIGQFPHCDQRVLHPLGACTYCDGHPEWQELRKAWGIAFTGQEPADGQLPCPADARRPPGAENDHRRWAGNVATGAQPVNETYASRLLYGHGPDESPKRSSWIERGLARFRSQPSCWGSSGLSGTEERKSPAVPPAPVISRLTTDPNDPRLGHGVNHEPGQQNEAYLVLSEEERAKGYVRPVRTSYKHLTCGSVTTMGRAIAETYAAKPSYYGATWCCACAKHLPVGQNGEFVWLDDGTKVGT